MPNNSPENSRKIVIGGGISGLIWTHFHPEYTIITPEVGGTYGKNHLVWLHDTAETRYLLKSLGFENIKSKKSLMGYYVNGWVHDETDPELQTLLIQKKMSEWDKPIIDPEELQSRKMSMSGDGDVNYLNSLVVDLQEVVKRLHNKANMIEGYVTRIDTDKVFYKTKLDDVEEKSLSYDRLVSTIPAPVFWDTYHAEGMWTDKPKPTFKYLPITNIVTSKKPKEFHDGYEMIYYVDTPFSRASFLDGAYALEFTGYMSKEQFAELYPDLPLEQYFVVKYGRIFENPENNPPQDNIVFLGRFAEWRFGITSEHVVKKSMDIKNF